MSKHLLFVMILLVSSKITFNQTFKDTIITSNWTMTGDYYGQVIIGADNVTIDMGPCWIIGNGSGNGINTNHKVNVTIRSGPLGGGNGWWSGQIQGFRIGIFINGGGCLVDNIWLTSNSYAGVCVEENSWAVGIHHCRAFSNYMGFRIDNSGGMTLSYCTSIQNTRDGYDQNGGSTSQPVNYYACNAYYNEVNGFEIDYATGGFTYTTCYSTGNERNNFSITDGASNGIFRNCIANNSKKEDGFHFRSGAGNNMVYNSRAENNGNGGSGDKNWDDAVGTNQAIPPIPN